MIKVPLFPVTDSRPMARPAAISGSTPLKLSHPMFAKSQVPSRRDSGVGILAQEAAITTVAAKTIANCCNFFFWVMSSLEYLKKNYLARGSLLACSFDFRYP